MFCRSVVWRKYYVYEVVFVDEIGYVIVTLIVILIKGTVFAVFSFTMATLLLGIVNFIRLVKKEISVKSEIPFVPYLGICAMVTALCM